MKLIYFLIFCPLLLLAKPNHPTPYEYRRWIRPQMKNIISDYYLLLENRLASKHSKEVINHFKSYNESYFAIYSLCKTWGPKCQRQLQVLPKRLKGLKAQLSNNSTHDILNIERSLRIISLAAQLENKVLLTTVPRSDAQNKITIRQIKDLSNEILLLTHQSLARLDPLLAPETYENLWIGFIRKLYLAYYTDNNTSFKLKYNNIGMAWNEFNNLLSQQVRTSQGPVKMQADLVQRRWNSILKIIKRF